MSQSYVIISCPNCKSVLSKVGNSLKCKHAHSFDFAKEGYVNLLLANQKKTSSPGDNREMITARDAFLSTGHFDFLIEGIESILSPSNLEIVESSDSINMLDLGCGSGYYTRSIFSNSKINRVGVDISKFAVAKAAKKDKNSTYLVGSVFDLNFIEESVDLLLNIFSPIDLNEVSRVLKSNGYFIKVIPAENHMREVAELVYDKFISHKSNIKEEILAHPKLEIVKCQSLTKRMSLSTEDVKNLVTMTPYLYKFTEENFDSLSEMEVTISFEIIIARFIQ